MKNQVMLRERTTENPKRPVTRAPRVLVVEDDEDVRSDLVLLLSEAGFDCLACRSAEQAANLMSARADIAVALVDIRLPGVSGLDFIGATRKRDGSVLPTRFIVTSGPDTDCEEPTARNSKRLPVNAKGDVRLRSPGSRSNLRI